MYENSADNRERILQIQKELNEKYKSEEIKSQSPKSVSPAAEIKPTESENSDEKPRGVLSFEKDDLILLFTAFLLLSERNADNGNEIDSLLLVLACLILL